MHEKTLQKKKNDAEKEKSENEKQQLLQPKS
jgi:hypothetical protein